MTAEFAAVIPAVLLVLGCCLGGYQLATVQARLQDAAATIARGAARGEAVSVDGLMLGVSQTTQRRGNLICVSVTRNGSVLSGLIGSVTITATSCTLIESP